MARRSDHSKEELIELVVSTTRELVDELGPNAVTARKIAEAVGYTPGTLYTHFANLNDVFLHVNALNLEHMQLQMRVAVDSAPGPKRALLEMAISYLNYAASHPNRFALMFTSHVPHGEDAPKHLQQRVDDLFSLVELQLRNLWPHLSDEELEISVRTLWGSVHGVVSLSVRDQLFTRTWAADRSMLRELVNRFLS